MSRSLLAALILICFGAANLSWSEPKKKKKKDEEEITQTLDEPKDPPPAITAEASKLVFFSTPLSAKGLLSAQIREAIKSLLSQTHGARIVKIRAFVAGSGDLRRVPSLVSEIFSDKKLTLPVVSVVQVGALPLTGAQVILEGTATDKRMVNPNGVAFLSGQAGAASEVPSKLSAALSEIKLQPDSVRRLTCFVDSLESEAPLRTALGGSYPRAPLVVAQLRRDSAGTFAECEAVAALDQAPAGALTLVGGNDRFADAALVGPGSVVFTGLQLAFGKEQKDLQLALQRFGRTLEGAGTNWQSVAFLPGFLLTESIRNPFRTERAKFISKPPASTTLVFEGLASLDASLGLEGIAVAASPAK